jgi:hypothetical protein
MIKSCDSETRWRFWIQLKAQSLKVKKTYENKREKLPFCSRRKLCLSGLNGAFSFYGIGDPDIFRSIPGGK